MVFLLFLLLSLIFWTSQPFFLPNAKPSTPCPLYVHHTAIKSTNLDSVSCRLSGKVVLKHVRVYDDVRVIFLRHAVSFF